MSLSTNNDEVLVKMKGTIAFQKGRYSPMDSESISSFYTQADTGASSEA